ncbi:ABC transporter permease [Kaistia terrae]|uniref:ABC transporter permease n=1 Tax=Kaistia terrae TaxID=537017 RepID=A0ABW0PRF6_9HYPH|nr:ABC transporter permease [Kaistia terrae]MCX5578433.1 ABC transporter permease [Kaistia terrae]
MTIETETLQPTRIANRPQRRAKRDLSRNVLLPWLSPIAILLVWWFVSAAGIVGPKVLPSPVLVVAAAWELTLNGRLPQALVASLGRVLAGTIIGVALGLAAGLLAGYYRAGQIVVDKPLQMLRAVPFNALVPLFIVAFGIGEWMKVSLIAVGVLVPIYLNTFAGVRNVDSKLVEVGLVYRAPRYLIAYKILFLGALPSILTGLRFSLAIAWIALVTSETVNANAGIGYILAQAQRFVRTDQVFLCIVIYAFLGILTDYLVRLLEGRLLAWRNTYDGR